MAPTYGAASLFELSWRCRNNDERYRCPLPKILVRQTDEPRDANQCLSHASPEAVRLESAPLLSLATYIGKQSAGHPIESESTPLNQADLQSGAKQFHQRIGQINVSCAQCHDARWGQKLAGVTIPQAHPTGYPIYRLEWQSVGSLQRRLRNCMTAVRAEPYDYGSPELLRLELYLAWRARGMPMETPAVRP
ncbi:MAG: sulfur oxidation c-type cytochrome SoxA [Pseudomonadota bacterium]